MKTINERMQQVFADTGLKKNELAKALGINPRSLYDYGQSTKPSIEVLLKMVETFNVNANWLLLGVGSVYRTTETSEPVTTTTTTHQVQDTTFNILGRQTVNKSPESPSIQDLQQLMNQITEMQKTISSLTQTNQQLVAKLLQP